MIRPLRGSWRRLCAALLLLWQRRGSAVALSGATGATGATEATGSALPPMIPMAPMIRMIAMIAMIAPAFETLAGTSVETQNDAASCENEAGEGKRKVPGKRGLPRHRSESGRVISPSYRRPARLCRRPVRLRAVRRRRRPPGRHRPRPCRCPAHCWCGWKDRGTGGTGRGCRPT